MNEQSLGVLEARFADIIWKHERIRSGELAKESEALLGWKKSTSFTVLKRLCEKGIFQNEGGIVSPLISREDFYAMQSERFVGENFAGSLPAFFAAFTKRKALSPEEIDEIRRLITDYEKGGQS